jgi:plastocyanin
MRALQGKRALPIGIVALGLVATASATTPRGPRMEGPPRRRRRHHASPSHGMPPSNTKTVVEGRVSFAFMPSTVTVTQGTTLKLDNVIDSAHTFTVTGQGIDVETQPGKTSQVTIDLEPGSYPFVCLSAGRSA